MFDSQVNNGFSLAVDQSAMPDFREWVFCPGMLFGSSDKWWGKRGHRERPHEGIDLLLYRDNSGNIHHIDETFAIPLLADGFVAGIINDFLGKSVIIEHPSFSGVQQKMLTIYGHTTPLATLTRGVLMKKGEIVATVAGRSERGFTMSPHLHITIARTRFPVSCDSLDWGIIGSGSGPLELYNPLDFLHSPFRLAEKDDAECIRASPFP